MPYGYSGRPYDPLTQQAAPGVGAGTWLANIGTGAASGAAAGVPFGPIGAGVGGLLGGLGGAFQSAAQAKAAKEQAAQQAALEAELGSRSLLDAFMLQARLLGGQQTQAQVRGAQEGAARLGLSPAAALGFEQQARAAGAMQQEVGLASALQAAAQAEQARRAGVLESYRTAQELANNAAPPNYGAQFAEALANIGKVAGLTEGKLAIKKEAAAADRGLDSALLPTSEVNPYVNDALTGVLTDARAAEWARMEGDPWGQWSETNPWGYIPQFYSEPSPEATLTPGERRGVFAADAARLLGELGSSVAGVPRSAGRAGGVRVEPPPAADAPAKPVSAPANGSVSMTPVAAPTDPVSYAEFEQQALDTGMLRPEQVTPALYQRWLVLMQQSSGVK